MNSKPILLMLCVYVASCGRVRSQANITLSASDIAGKRDYNTKIATTQFTSLISVGSGRVSISATTPVLTSDAGISIPLDQIFLKLISIGGTDLHTAPEIRLSRSSQDLYNGSFAHHTGAVIINYRIPASTYNWPAGTYKTNLAFTYTGLPGRLIQSNKLLTITIPPFIEAPGILNPANAILRVNSLNQFRNTGVSTNVSLGTVVTTLPFNINLRTAGNAFTYAPVAGNTGVDKSVDINTVSLSVNALPPVQLHYGRTSMGIFSQSAVPTGNRTAILLNYSISSTMLTDNYIYAGDYAVSLTYKAYATDNSASISSPNNTILIRVDDMGELLVNDPAVNLDFNNAADYVNGKSVEMAAHLKLSKTTPYDVYVKASGSNLTSGANSIPVNIIKIGPASGEKGVETATLSTAPTKLISAADPVIDREIGIKYTIDPAAAKTLVNKPSGTYTATLTYSFIAN